MFVGPFMTALEPDDLLVDVAFPPQPATSGWSFREFATRPGDYATVGVATQLTAEAQRIAGARVALFGVTSSAHRASVVEEALIGISPERGLDPVREALRSSIEPTDDLHASAEMRMDLAEQLVTESITEAWERCS